MANPLKRIQRFFSISVKDDPSSITQKTLVPAQKDPDDPNKVSPAKFPPEIQRLYDWWLRETQDTSETLKNRIDRYTDLNFMVKNDTVISMAMDLYADESTQADSQEKIILLKQRIKK